MNSKNALAVALTVAGVLTIVGFIPFDASYDDLFPIWLIATGSTIGASIGLLIGNVVLGET